MRPFGPLENEHAAERAELRPGGKSAAEPIVILNKGAQQKADSMGREHLRSHIGYRRLFANGALTLGVVFPLVRVAKAMPDMSQQLRIAELADSLGFASLWARDVPLYDPSSPDVGQLYDPWVWLGAVAAATRNIALCTAAIVLPVRHPLHVAKAAATVDVLSGGRFVLGIASGDRPREFAAFNVSHDDVASRFRDAHRYMLSALHEDFPEIDSPMGNMAGLDLLPKPLTGKLPHLSVGNARQTIEWIAGNTDGWVTYPRDIESQRKWVELWRTTVQRQSPERFLPFSELLFVELEEHADADAIPVYLGYKLGRRRLVEHLDSLREIGINHVILNLTLNNRPISEVMQEIAEYVLPFFPLPTAEVAAK